MLPDTHKLPLPAALHPFLLKNEAFPTGRSHPILRILALQLAAKPVREVNSTWISNNHQAKPSDRMIKISELAEMGIGSRNGDLHGRKIVKSLIATCFPQNPVFLCKIYKENG